MKPEKFQGVPDTDFLLAGSKPKAAARWYQCTLAHMRHRILVALMVISLSLILVLLQCLYPGLVCCNHGIQVDQLDPSRDATIEYTDENGETHMRYKHTKRRLPQAIIIGVRKGGTRALLEFLNLHPQIQAEKGEMHFFDDDETYKNGLDWYRRKMPYSFNDQLTIEKTPAYFTEEMVPERVYRMNSSIKILMTLRDPVERAISDYTQIHTNKELKGRYHEPFEDLAIDSDGEVDKSYKAIRRSLYYRHMARWLKYYNLSQFHFVNGETLVQDPVQELRKVEDFLGVEHKLTRDRFFLNKTRGFFCMKLEHKEKCLAPSKGRQHPDIPTRVLHKLRKFFKPYNQRFYNQIGIDFGWPES